MIRNNANLRAFGVVASLSMLFVACSSEKSSGGTSTSSSSASTSTVDTTPDTVATTIAPTRCAAQIGFVLQN